jgi:hypothetical protein
METGPNFVYFALSFWAAVSFFASQWEEHETHVLRHGMSFFGVTERKYL